MYGKKIATMLMMAAAFTTTGAEAQVKSPERPQTLLGAPVSHGGFGATSARVTSIGGETTVLTGGQLAWLVNHRAFLGLEGWSSAADNLKVTAPGATTSERLDVSYGGLSFGYILQPASVVHATARILAGAGTLGVGERPLHESRNGDDIFYVVEPAVGVEVNVARFLRLGAGASYRVARDVEVPGLRDKDLSGFSGELMLRFGKF